MATTAAGHRHFGCGNSMCEGGEKAVATAGRRRVEPSLHRQFYEAIKTYSSLLRLRERARWRNDAASQEKSFFKNFWNFAKSAVAGSVGKEAEAPSFSREEANEWYRRRYSTPVSLDREAISWFPPLQD